MVSAFTASKMPSEALFGNCFGIRAATSTAWPTLAAARAAGSIARNFAGNFARNCGPRPDLPDRRGHGYLRTYRPRNHGEALFRNVGAWRRGGSETEFHCPPGLQLC